MNPIRRSILKLLGLGAVAAPATAVAVRPKPTMLKDIPAKLEHFSVGDIHYVSKLNDMVDAVNELRRRG